MSNFNWQIPDAPPFPPLVSVPAGSIDHVNAALNRLCEQFRDRPNVIALVTALVTPCQSLEGALFDLFVKRTIDAAFGATLDALGNIVGQPRNGLSDADYRPYIRARVATNRSRGLPEDLIAIARLVLTALGYTFTVVRTPIASVIVRALGVATTDALGAALISFLRSAVVGGVRIVLESEPDLDANTFFTETITWTEDPMSIGETGSGMNTSDNMINFPVSGTITIDTAGNAESVDYYFANGASGTDVNPVFRTPLTKNHAGGVQVLLTSPTPLGKGTGDSGDSGQPTLVPYSNVGTTGGRLIDARE